MWNDSTQYCSGSTRQRELRAQFMGLVAGHCSGPHQKQNIELYGVEWRNSLLIFLK